jgi:hypothetical protein
MDPGVTALIAIALCVVVFMICRAIVLWYWRVNEAISLLKSIDEKLGVLAANTPRSPTIGEMRP